MSRFEAPEFSLPGNLPKVIALAGHPDFTLAFTRELSTHEPLLVVDLDYTLHESLTDLAYPAGLGEDIDWYDRVAMAASVPSSAPPVSFFLALERLRAFVDYTFGPTFRASRVLDVLRHPDELPLVVIPNLRTAHEHRTLAAAFRPSDYLALHLRSDSVTPDSDLSWTYTESNPRVHLFEDTGGVSYFSQFVDLLDVPPGVTSKEPV